VVEAKTTVSVTPGFWRPKQVKRNAAWRSLKENEMRISSTDSIDGGRILYPIGKIKAASSWHAAEVGSHQAETHQGDWREMALRELIQRAEDIDADAIIDVNYEMDRVVPAEDAGVSLRRVLATGTAVRLAVAA
jgi:uncharacterized protein YbjQ (UPF0145 family)